MPKRISLSTPTVAPRTWTVEVGRAPWTIFEVGETMCDMPCSSTVSRPSVAIIRVTGAAPRSGCMISRWVSSPIAAQARTPTAKAGR